MSRSHSPSGKLRTRLIVQYPIRSGNTFGEEITSFVTTGLAWAAVEPLSGSKLFMAQQVRPDLTHTVEMRYRSDIQVDWRFLFVKNQNRVLNIHHVFAADEYSGKLMLGCTELVISQD